MISFWCFCIAMTGACSPPRPNSSHAKALDVALLGACPKVERFAGVIPAATLHPQRKLRELTPVVEPSVARWNDPRAATGPPAPVISFWRSSKCQANIAPVDICCNFACCADFSSLIHSSRSAWGGLLSVPMDLTVPIASSKKCSQLWPFHANAGDVSWIPPTSGSKNSVTTWPQNCFSLNSQREANLQSGPNLFLSA